MKTPTIKIDLLNEDGSIWRTIEIQREVWRAFLKKCRQLGEDPEVRFNKLLREDARLLEQVAA